MWEFPKIGVPYFGVLIIRILLFRVLHLGPLFSETPMCLRSIYLRLESIYYVGTWSLEDPYNYPGTDLQPAAGAWAIGICGTPFCGARILSYKGPCTHRV